jgi:hypothetical protein
MLSHLFSSQELLASEAYYQARRSYEIDPNQDFVRVKSRIGLRASIIYAQMYFADQPRYKRFRRAIELHKFQRNQQNKNYDVLIVLPPRGLLPKEWTQAMLRQAMGLATSAGFAHISQAQLNTDRVLLGAKRLHQLIKEKNRQQRRVIVVSFSYGSAFARVLFDQSSPRDLQGIQGWVNLAGLIFGSPRYNCSNKVRLFFSSTPAQRTFSCEQQYFKTPMRRQNFQSLHFLGMQSQMSEAEWRMREKLRAWGPNDGVISFAPFQKLEQTVIPLPDQGPLINLDQMSMTFICSLSSLVSTLPMKTKTSAVFEQPETSFIEGPRVF